MKNKVTVSINITAHKEGPLLRPTLLSVTALVDTFMQKYPKKIVEINIGLDNPDSLTRSSARDYAERSRFTANVYENTFGDPSKNRNFLLEKSSGEYVFFHDADDLFGGNFLVEAYKKALTIGRPCVVSPEFILPFDQYGIQYIQKNLETTAARFYKTSFFSANSFISENLVHREIYEKVKYNLNIGLYGHEDWHWNTEVIAAGYDFYTAGGTLFFYRIKAQSESVRLAASAKNVIIARSKLFEPGTFLSLTHTPMAAYEAIPASCRIDEPTGGAAENAFVEPARLTRVVAGMRRRAQRRMSVSGRPYLFMAHQYRSFQQLFSPALSWVRSPNNITQFVRHQKRSVLGLVRGASVAPLPAFLKSNTDMLKLNIQRLRDIGIGETQLSEWRSLNKIENNIIYSLESLANTTVIFNAKLAAVDELYYRFCADYHERGITDIILMPHITVGGADNAMIRLTKQLCSKGRKVLVVTTIEGNVSPAAPKIIETKGAYHFNLGDPVLGVDDEGRKLFLTRVLQHWGIKTLTVMNSMIGYEILAQYGDMIASLTTPYIFTYSQGRNALCLTHEYFPLRRAWPYAKKIITDSQTFSNELQSYYGWTRDKVGTCLLPYDSEMIPEKTSGPTKKILFMSRLASEKQVDVLLDVAAKLRKYEIHVDIYGIKDEMYCHRIDFDNRVALLDNVTFMGSVPSYESISIDEYDIHILTSSYEGIPITLLDSVKANLFIVSSRVGGIGEVVIDGENGLLVNENRSVDEYVAAIRRYYESKALQSLAKRRDANKIIIAEHSPAAYAHTIDAIYLDDKEAARG